METFVAEVEALAPEHKKLAEALIKKIGSYYHWPDSKKLGIKLLPFTESKEMVFLLADILKNNKHYPEFLRDSSVSSTPDMVSYCTFVHIFILYIVNQKEGCEKIVSTLSYLADKAIETAMKDEWDNKYYMLKWIFKVYKADKEPLLSELVKKFDAVPKDKLRFVPIYDGTAYAVQAYSEFTCGDVKIPSSYNGKPVREINNNAFGSCTKLTSIDIPEGIEIIRSQAFSGCHNLKDVVLPESLREIGSHVFSTCDKLENIIIPKNVIKMKESIFQLIEIEKLNIKVVGYTEKPEGWDKDWHLYTRGSYHNVIWDYKVEEKWPGIYKVKFPNSFGYKLPQESEVRKLQERYGFSDGYAKFLMTQNGLNCYACKEPGQGESFVPDDRDSEDMGSDIRYLYGLHSGDEYGDLEENIRDREMLLPYFFPIGDDKGGNPYVEVLAGPHKGKIGGLDHDMLFPADTLAELLEEEDGDMTEEQQIELLTSDDFGLFWIHAPSIEVFLQDCVFADSEFFGVVDWNPPKEAAVGTEDIANLVQRLKSKMPEGVTDLAGLIEATRKKTIAFAEELKENSGMSDVPEDLMRLINFQENFSDCECYSQGFSVFCDDYSDALESWSDDEEFLSRLYPFAQANCTGSFYCIWNDGSERSLGEMPIVVFGDEGGVHIVAENLSQLFHLLSYDTEISVDFDKAYFYKDDDYEESEDLGLFLSFFLKSNYGFDQISEPDEVIESAQEKYKDAFDEWFKKYYKE